MRIPTIHLNGTRRDSLIDELGLVAEAIDTAYQAMKRTAPNGRDYYPQGNTALDEAMTEHQSRLRRLDEIKGEIEFIAIEIDRQSARPALSPATSEGGK